MMFSLNEKERYARHFVLPGFGTEGQQRLRVASVLIVGAGALGSPLAVYLAAAGVGRIGIIDADSVERSNLHRQVLYGEEDIGRLKVERARDRMISVNPNVTVAPIAERLTSENALDIFRGYENRRRHRQFRNAVLGERCRRIDRSTGCLWLDFSIRRSGDGPQPRDWSLLPVPLPCSSASRGGAQLCGRRRSRGDAGNHWISSGT